MNKNVLDLPITLNMSDRPLTLEEFTQNKKNALLPFELSDMQMEELVKARIKRNPEFEFLGPKDVIMRQKEAVKAVESGSSIGRAIITREEEQIMREFRS